MWIESTILPANGSFQSEPIWIPASSPPPSNWWEAGGAAGVIAAWQPKGAANYAASKVNLANPGTNDAADIVAPNWDTTNGWKFDVNLQVLDSTIVPKIGMTTIYQYTNVNTANFALGIAHFNGSGDRSELGNFFGSNIYSGTTAGSVTSAGNLCLVFNTAGYKDGSLDTSSIAGTVDNSATLTSCIGARRREDIASIDLYVAAVGASVLYIQAAAYYNSLLTAPQVAAVAAAMAAI